MNPSKKSGERWRARVTLGEFSDSPQLSTIPTNFLIIIANSILFCNSYIIPIAICCRLNSERLIAKTLRVHILSTRRAQGNADVPQIFGIVQSISIVFSVFFLRFLNCSAHTTYVQYILDSCCSCPCSPPAAAYLLLIHVKNKISSGFLFVPVAYTFCRKSLALVTMTRSADF